MNCAICKAMNPDGKQFCGDCGAPLDQVMARIKDYVDSGVGREIMTLRDRFSDQRAVEIETTQKIAARLADWAKIFGIVLGIPIGGLTVVLTFMGWNTYKGLSDTAHEIKESIKTKGSEVEKLAAALEEKQVTLTAEWDQYATQLAQLKAGQADVKSKVEQIEEKILRYEPSSALTPDLQHKLDDAIEHYQRFLASVGFKLQPGKVTVSINAEMADNSYYDIDKKRLVLGPVWANDTTVLFREYNHHALIEAGGGNTDNRNLQAIESGLADYFCCSFSGDPTIGRTVVALLSKSSASPLFGDRTYIRTMDNHNKFDDLNDTTELHEAGETLGGALWEIRREIDKNTADRLILSAWIALNKPGSPVSMGNAEMFTKFAEALVSTAKGADAKTIRRIFESRGLTFALEPEGQ
jgi:hypothetical protein